MKALEHLVEGITPIGVAPARRSVASLEAGRTRVHLAGALGTLEGGKFAIEELKWEERRWSSRGEFSRLPAAPLLAFSAADGRVASTLNLSGRWAFAATPRVTGTLSVSRDDGDLAPIDTPELVLGLTQLELVAVSTDEAAPGVVSIAAPIFDRVGACVAIYECERK